jgi:hypothetical protein
VRSGPDRPPGAVRAACRAVAGPAGRCVTSRWLSTWGADDAGRPHATTITSRD